MREGFPAHGGDLEWAAERYGLDPRDFLDFSSNLNPLGPPERALEAARAALREVARYPEPDADRLKAALARFLDLDRRLLVLGNGSSELIHHLSRCVLSEAFTAGEVGPGGGGAGRPPGRARVMVAVPAFGEYERAARIAGAELSFHALLPGDGFSLRPETLAEEASRSRLTFFCNPASPTGRLYRRKELLPVLEACRAAGGILVVDESFMSFCPPGEAEEATLLEHAGEEGLAVLSTLTKVFALAGLRGPGWLAGPEVLVSYLEERAVPWRVNVAAEAAAMASLEDEGFLAETRAAVASWREELAEGLAAAGLFHVFPSRTNFILLRLTGAEARARELVDALGRRGILVRDCGNFRGLGEGFLRVAVKRPEENRRLLRALEEAAGELRIP